MVTRKKNKSAHPGIPDMTPSQLASAGLSTSRSSNKKPTKTQEIAALKDELQAVRELVSKMVRFTLHYLYPFMLTSIYFLEWS